MLTTLMTIAVIFAAILPTYHYILEEICKDALGKSKSRNKIVD
jgi:hypothetical protein